ncbi:MAG: hypothetical protein N2651_06155 [Fimbriimonadales bacterium]|nr:hypothetical protein [Fimbriimonadales bacterium]
MLDIAKMTASLAEAFPEPQAQRIALVISEAVQSVFESEVIKRIDQLREEMRESDRRIEAKLDQLVEVVSENTRAIVELRAVVERHDEQIAANTRAIAENAHAITELRKAIEKHDEQIVRLVAVAEKHDRRLTNIERIQGGMAMTLGYTLENAAYKALPALLERDYGIRVEGQLTRDYVVGVNGEECEVNILGKGFRNGEPVTIVGESKIQLSVQEIDRFIRRKLKPIASRVVNPFPVLVAHMVSSTKVIPHAKEKGIAVYLSYEFD